MEMNYFGTACKIIKYYVELFPESPSKKPFFCGYKNLSDWVREEGQSDYNLQRVLESSLPELSKAKEYAENNLLELSSAECMMLVEMIKILEDILYNRRFQDPFGSLFVCHMKMFNLINKKTAGLEKRKYLRSKEVIWAIHSQQIEGLFDICFPKDMQSSPQFMNWENFKKYCVPLWFDDGMKLKSYVEKMALIEYKQTR